MKFCGKKLGRHELTKKAFVRHNFFLFYSFSSETGPFQDFDCLRFFWARAFFQSGKIRRAAVNVSIRPLTSIQRYKNDTTRLNISLYI